MITKPAAVLTTQWWTAAVITYGTGGSEHPLAELDTPSKEMVQPPYPVPGETHGPINIPERIT